VEPSVSSEVVSIDGLRGEIAAADPFQNDMPQLLLRMENGREVWVPANLLEVQEDGTYLLPFNLEQIDEQLAVQKNSQETYVLPVVEEQVQVQRRRVKTGTVRLNKRVHEREEVVDEPEYIEEVDVERVPVNQQIEAPLRPRYEGDTLVIPVMEEVLVVERRLMLKEEIRVTKRRQTVHNPQKIILRSEEILVERIPGEKDE
jgi:uncharacterized protein (TIGR02271 family)